ncbi:MAG TPA: cytochrome c [Chitinophagaceae bacterium]|nr:cytochrome c [Chitinophagaceae bacterium]
MKKWLIICGMVFIGALVTGCGKVRRSTGRAYMPDMTYSRAYETYATSTEKLLKEKGIYYNGMPVPGTVARGDLFPYTLKNDSLDYNVKSLSVKSPLDPASIDMTEAERLYLVNCAICHGTGLDGNGPLVKSQKFPVSAADFRAEKYVKMPEGQMFQSITYGINMMGSYASQLSSKQRWMVIAYIKSKQSAQASVAKTDSTAAPKPK